MRTRGQNDRSEHVPLLPGKTTDQPFQLGLLDELRALQRINHEPSPTKLNFNADYSLGIYQAIGSPNSSKQQYHCAEILQVIRNFITTSPISRPHLRTSPKRWTG